MACRPIVAEPDEVKDRRLVPIAEALVADPG
jgi:hypothetical protein